MALKGLVTWRWWIERGWRRISQKAAYESRATSVKRRHASKRMASCLWQSDAHSGWRTPTKASTLCRRWRIDIPAADRIDFIALSDEMALSPYFEQLVLQRRRTPGVDLVSRLLRTNCGAAASLGANQARLGR